MHSGNVLDLQDLEPSIYFREKSGKIHEVPCHRTRAQETSS